MARGAGNGNRGRRAGGGVSQPASEGARTCSPPRQPRRLAWSFGPIQFPCRMLCRCSGADWKSALLLFPSQGGRLAPHTKPALPRMGGRAWGQGSAEGAGSRGQFTRRVTASVQGLGPREPMARTRTLRQLPTARSRHGHECGHSWGCFPDFMVLSEGKRGFPGLGSDRKMTLSCSESDGSVTVAIPVSGASAE